MKIKLRDMTKKQFEVWKFKNCRLNCNKCFFNKVNCRTSEPNMLWINNKDLFSDKFLNQEIEIEKYDSILTKKEKEYLENIIRPFKDKIDCIVKKRWNNKEKVGIFVKDFENENIVLPYFDERTMYRNMIVDKCYTLKELGLFDNEN